MENSEIGGFEIEEGDMKTMDGLDEYLVTGKSLLDSCQIRDSHGRVSDLGDTMSSKTFTGANVVRASRLGPHRLPIMQEDGAAHAWGLLWVVHFVGEGCTLSWLHQERVLRRLDCPFPTVMPSNAMLLSRAS